MIDGGVSLSTTEGASATLQIHRSLRIAEVHGSASWNPLTGKVSYSFKAEGTDKSPFLNHTSIEGSMERTKLRTYRRSEIRYAVAGGELVGIAYIAADEVDWALLFAALAGAA